MGGGRWEVGDGRWAVGGRRYEVGSGRWKLRGLLIFHFNAFKITNATSSQNTTSRHVSKECLSQEETTHQTRQLKEKEDEEEP